VKPVIEICITPPKFSASGKEQPIVLKALFKSDKSSPRSRQSCFGINENVRMRVPLSSVSVECGFKGIKSSSNPPIVLFEELSNRESQGAINAFRNLRYVGDGQRQKNGMLQPIEHHADTIAVFFASVRVAVETKPVIAVDRNGQSCWAARRLETIPLLLAFPEALMLSVSGVQLLQRAQIELLEPYIAFWMAH
jgi:hypothetical protein